MERGQFIYQLPLEALRKVCDMLMAMREPQGDSHEPAYVGLRTVVSLARTSRVLHEPAVDAIWDTIPAFGLLAYTLPQDVWTGEWIGRNMYHDTTWEVVRLSCNFQETYRPHFGVVSL